MTAKIKNAAHRRANQQKYRPRGVSQRKFERVYWPYLPLVALVTAVLAFGSQGGAFASAAIHKVPGGHVLAYSTSMSVSGLLSATNAQRSANGASSLTLNSKLTAAAQAKANDMAARNYWSHNTPEGNPPWVFDDAQGYAYLKLGENLATGFSNEQATINGWMASPPHKENLLDTDFTEVGFGFANNPDYTAAGGGPMTIVVAHYGKPYGASAPAPAPTPVTPPPAATVSPPPAAPAAESAAPPSTETAPTSEAGQQNDTVAPTEPDEDKDQGAVPATTETPTGAVTLSYSASRAQVAMGTTSVAYMATGLASFGLFAAAGLWVTKHAFGLRRVFVGGEQFVVHHPIVDVALLALAAMLYLMTQTAGFIK